MMMTAQKYAEYIKHVYSIIHRKKEYITKLDSATGDGDHWTNLDMGFEKLNSLADQLAQMTLEETFKKIGLTMMTVIGGSSGILYASGYFEAAKELKDIEAMDISVLADVLEAMLRGIMNRGNAKPGMKTMVDPLDAAVRELKMCVKNHVPTGEAARRASVAAKDGAEKTREMEAVRGRAYYQPNKGVGHLDPGAVTMYYQLKELFKCYL